MIAVIIGQLFDVQGKLASVIGVVILVIAPGKLSYMAKFKKAGSCT